MRDRQKFISVFTPVYNRVSTIDRVWNSLLNQTYSKFEWIIVDDGSTDEIDKQVKYYCDVSSFCIKYYKQPKNLGKHLAIKKGAELAEGELFLIADSDDAFKPESLEFFHNAWYSIPSLERNGYCSIRVCCEDQYGNRISNYLPESPMDLDMDEAFYKYKFTKESWSIDRTDLIRAFDFPFDHEGYFPEGILWRFINRNKKLRFFNDCLRVYYIEKGDSLMYGKKRLIEKSQSRLALSLDRLENDIEYFNYRPLYFMRMSILFNVYSLVRSNWSYNFVQLPIASKVIVLISFLPSLLYYSIAVSNEKIDETK